MMKMTKKVAVFSDSGFTLIELLVVISIIGVLVAVLLPIYRNFVARGRDQQRLADVNTLQQALEHYRVDNSIYPTTSDLAFSVSSSLIQGSKTYLKKVPLDPLSSAPQYKYAPLPLGCDNTPIRLCLSYCLYVKLEQSTYAQDLSDCSNDPSYNLEVTLASGVASVWLTPYPTIGSLPTAVPTPVSSPTPTRTPTPTPTRTPTPTPSPIPTPTLSPTPVPTSMPCGTYNTTQHYTTTQSQIGAGTVWINLADFGPHDSVFASSPISAGQQTQTALLTGYGFNIPAGANIKGIVLEILKGNSNYASPVHPTDLVIQLLKSGIPYGINKAGSPWTDSFSVVSYGSATDLWGGAWTAADINASNFGAAIAAQGPSGMYNLSVMADYVVLNVWYSPAGCP